MHFVIFQHFYSIFLECQVGACIIERENCNIPCENLMNYPCVNKCNAYARCFYRRYYVSYCNWGYYDIDSKSCQRNEGQRQRCSNGKLDNGNTKRFIG